jgi:hypothetical protein
VLASRERARATVIDRAELRGLRKARRDSGTLA